MRSTTPSPSTWTLRFFSLNAPAIALSSLDAPRLSPEDGNAHAVAVQTTPNRRSVVMKIRLIKRTFTIPFTHHDQFRCVLPREKTIIRSDLITFRTLRGTQEPRR